MVGHPEVEISGGFSNEKSAGSRILPAPWAKNGHCWPRHTAPGRKSSARLRPSSAAHRPLEGELGFIFRLIAPGARVTLRAGDPADLK